MNVTGGMQIGALQINARSVVTTSAICRLSVELGIILAAAADENRLLTCSTFCLYTTFYDINYQCYICALPRAT